jgi:pyruvate/2-oxoglutarate dehydrogenase complex dihydrolipoamide acyltransferase (E2) component
MLFAAAVLVEGAAELFLIPAFAERMGMLLDELGISVAAVHGSGRIGRVRRASASVRAISRGGAGAATPATTVGGVRGRP